MKKVNSKKKWFLAAAVAMCLGILIAIPLYSEVPKCPRPDYITKFPFAQDCRWFFLCDGTRVWPWLEPCPVDRYGNALYFCPEKQTCTWPWDPECTFDCG